MVFLSEADYRRWDLLMQIILYTFPLQFHTSLSLVESDVFSIVLSRFAFSSAVLKNIFFGIKKHLLFSVDILQQLGIKKTA